MARSRPTKAPLPPPDWALFRIPLAGLLGWVLPGLGHLFIRDRRRGWIIMITLATTFWGGIAIGGVRNTVDPQRRKLWFLAQVCNGAHTVAAYALGEVNRSRLVRDHLGESAAGVDPRERKLLEDRLIATDRWNSVEIAYVYTGVAGLLNVLAMLDVLMRADPNYRRTQAAAASASAARA